MKHSNGRILMIFRNGKWDLPKGRIEKKELSFDAAVREVNEETGVADLIIIKPLPITYHIFARKGKHRLKKTYWFSSNSSRLFAGVKEYQTETELPFALKHFKTSDSS